MEGMLPKVFGRVSLSVSVYASPGIPDRTILLTLTVVGLGSRSVLSMSGEQLPHQPLQLLTQLSTTLWTITGHWDGNAQSSYIYTDAQPRR